MFVISLAVALAVYLFSLGLEYVFHRVRQKDDAGSRVRRHAVYHLPHTLLAFLLLPAWILVFLLPRHSGVVLPRHLPHVLPPYRVAGGSVRSLDAYAPPIYDQGSSEACGSFSTLTALQIEEKMRGERVPVLSPWYQYQFASGCHDRPTTLDAQFWAYFWHGQVPFSWEPMYTCPGQIVGAREKGGHYWYVFTDNTGAGPVSQAIANDIAHGFAPILLLNVNIDLLSAYGATDTDNGGAYAFTHFVTATSWRRGSDGIDIEIQNSWGSLWGTNGRVWLSQAALSPGSLLEAAVVAPGAAQWPRPTPRAKPTPRPTPHPRPRPTLHPRPTPRPTPHPRHSSLSPR